MWLDAFRDEFQAWYDKHFGHLAAQFREARNGAIER